MDDLKVIDIPNSFNQDSEGKPFHKCTFCSSELQNSGIPYVVEKSFKKPLGQKDYVTVFEYAICMNCSIKKMEVISKESMKTIQEYMANNVHSMKKQFDLISYDEKVSKCAVTGKNINELEEYNMVGQFIGDKLILKEFPIIISSEIGEEIQSLLSKETKEEFDKFMDTINDVPPELKELFKTKRPVFA